MSDERTMEAIQRDYNEACAELGHISYQLHAAYSSYSDLSKDLTDKITALKAKVADLNHEAIAKHGEVEHGA